MQKISKCTFSISVPSPSSKCPMETTGDCFFFCCLSALRLIYKGFLSFAIIYSQSYVPPFRPSLMEGTNACTKGFKKISCCNLNCTIHIGNSSISVLCF